jgi:SagB-type dehydrogenase family enzyme
MQPNTINVWHAIFDGEPGDVSLAEEFHEASKFHAATLGRDNHARRVNADEALTRASGVGARSLTHLARVDLPRPDRGRELRDKPALFREPSADAFDRRPVDASTIGRLLWLAYGAHPSSDPNRPRRPIASGGALYPLELYVLADVRGAGSRGAYHYDVRGHGLEELSPAVDPADWRRMTLGEPLVEMAQLVVVISALFGRCTFKYGLRGYRFCLLEAGALIHQMQLAAQALGLASRPYAAFMDDAVDDICELDGVDESFVNAVLIGHPASGI